MTMRRALTGTLLLLLLAACSGPPLSNTEAEPPSPSPSPAFDRLDVYEPLLRSLSGGGSRFDQPLIIVREVCVNLLVANENARCDPPFSGEEQEALAARLDDLSNDVRFARSLDDSGMTPSNSEGARVVWVGPLDKVDGGYWSVAGQLCGGLCGGGGTFVLERHGDAWEVTGHAPGTPTWVS